MNEKSKKQSIGYYTCFTCYVAYICSPILLLYGFTILLAACEGILCRAGSLIGAL